MQEYLDNELVPRLRWKSFTGICRPVRYSKSCASVHADNISRHLSQNSGASGEDINSDTVLDFLTMVADNGADIGLKPEMLLGLRALVWQGPRRATSSLGFLSRKFFRRQASRPSSAGPFLSQARGYCEPPSF